jgi:ABC-2 type transport system ATP-binding protein
MLTLSGITKSFGGRRVLDGVDLNLEAGERVALLGANGSGKTTTLRCIAGLAHADSGSIVVAGQDLAADPVGARARMSYLPQKSAFPATLTVRETLSLVAKLRRLDTAAVDREIHACQLDALAARGVAHLSGGERQRLAMAVAFLPTVDVYLFDEPSASLDPTASRLLFTRAKRLADDGRTLLFTTHVPADVRHLATRIVLLRNGRIESDAAGTFELRRYERMLEREMWGDDHEPATSAARMDDGGDLRRMPEPHALRGAAAGRSC